jgi:hypothetical protein
MDAHPNSSFSQFVNRFSLVELLRNVGAFCTWNGEMSGFARPHLLVQRIVDCHSGQGHRGVNGSVIRKALELATTEDRVYRDGRTHSASEERATPRSLDGLRIMQAGISSIVNAGMPPQMLNYALDRFGQFDDLLRSRLGFSIEDACFASQVVSSRIVDATERFLTPDSAPRRRWFGEERYARRLLVPPARFVSAWLDSTSYPVDAAELHGASNLTHRLVDFLTTPTTGFSSRNKSFSRWAFVREDDGRSGLLISQMLADTVVSAVQLGLLERLTPAEKGAYGNRLGRGYEGIVENIFHRHYPELRTIPRVRDRPDASEIDLVVECDPEFCILVECKGKAIQPGARWGDARLFLSNLRQNIIEGAAQAQKAISEYGNPERIRSVFLVLDAYFPSATFLSYGGGGVASAIEPLPLPVITTHYDLDYLLRKIPATELPTYLKWRVSALKSRRLVVVDEFDLVRAYFTLRTMPEVGLLESGGKLVFLGRDRDYEKILYEEFFERLLAIPPSMFAFDTTSARSLGQPKPTDQRRE